MSAFYAHEEETLSTYFANSLIGLRADLIADHMVRIVAIDELFAGIDLAVAEYNDAAAAASPVVPPAGPPAAHPVGPPLATSHVVGTIGVVEQVVSPSDVVVPTAMEQVSSVEPYTETQVALALSQIEANSGAVAPVEDPADWSAEEDEEEGDEEDDDDGDVLLDDAAEQDQQRQVLEERAVRTTYTTLEQLAAAGVYPDWDCVYGHAEFLVTCGGLHAQDDDFIVTKLLDTHSGV